MLNYFIILIFLVILYYIDYGSIKNEKLLKKKKKKHVEKYKNYILDIKKNIENSDYLDGYTMIKLKNPSDNEFVLQQDPEAIDYYKFTLSLECNKNYRIFYWKSSSDDYDGDDFFIKILRNINGKYTNILSAPNITCRKVLNGLIWAGIEHTFKSYSKEIYVTIPSMKRNNDKKNKNPPIGSRYYSNLKISRYYPQLSHYELQHYLTAYIICRSEYNIGKSILDLTQNSHMSFENYPIIDNYGVYVENNQAKIEHTYKLLDPKNLTIVFTYTPESYENGSLIYVPVLNDYNFGIDISFQTNASSYYNLVLNVVNVNYIFNIGLIHNPINIILVIKDSIPSVYHDGRIINFTSNHADKIIDRGTCPDGWLHKSQNLCTPNIAPTASKQVFDSDDYTEASDTNVSVSTTEPPIDYNLTDTTLSECKTFEGGKFINNNKKKSWSEKCNVSWSNCKKTKLGEISPDDSKSCDKDLGLNFTNFPIQINKDNDLSGRLLNLFLYKTSLSSNDAAYIYDYVTQIISSGDDGSSNSINRPTLTSSRVHTYSKHNEYSTKTHEGIGDNDSNQFNTCNINSIVNSTSASGTSSTEISTTNQSADDISAVGARDSSTTSDQYVDPNINKINSCINNYNKIPKTNSKCNNCKSNISIP